MEIIFSFKQSKQSDDIRCMHTILSQFKGELKEGNVGF